MKISARRSLLALTCAVSVWLALGAAALAVAATPGPPAVDQQSAEAGTTYVTLRAKINPDGFDTTCQVQYVEDSKFQESQWAGAMTRPCAPEDLGAGSGDVEVQVKARGLAIASVYHYRFLPVNQAGAPEGPGGTFETFNIEEFRIEDLKNSLGVNGYGEWQGPGELETQAGSHPYELVTTIALNKTTLKRKKWESVGNSPGWREREKHEPGANAKDLQTLLPPGLIGNPTAIPRCNRFLEEETKCPADTQVGVMEITAGEGTHSPGFKNNFWEVPIHNLVPSGPYPAEFGAFIEGAVGAWIPFHVRTGGDYGITADSINLTTEGSGLEKVVVRIWGTPADSSHEPERSCPTDVNYYRPCGDTEPQVPLLTNPTACEGPLNATLLVDTWQEPGNYVKATAELPAFTGCNQLEFRPSVEAKPTTNVADQPSGLDAKIHVPQDLTEEGFEDPTGKATSDLKETKVDLPPGLLLNPSAASGLQGCSSAQIELHGPNAPSCPDAAKIGTVKVHTQLVDHPLPGAVYVATPYDNPFHSLLAIYIVVDDPGTGVVIKLAGHVEADPETGQLTTTVQESPQLPFEDFELEFFEGARAALRTAPTCGAYETKSVLTPWAAPELGPVSSSNTFEIEKSPSGGACPTQASQEPNSPSFAAGTETPAAGAYSPFVLHLHREDGSQEIEALNTTLPPGLAAKLAGVAECPESALAAAAAKSGTEEQGSPSCPAGSEVGTVNVAAGAGPAPYWTQGHVYLAGPYKGAPLSVAIVTPAVAGPYDLGDVVVRAALYVDPFTAQVSVKSDPIPTILKGIPLDVRTINVKMGRRDFTLNPTNCEPMAVTGEAFSAFGRTVTLSNPFQVGGCRALGFEPQLSLRLEGSPKRAHFPALTATLTMPEPGTHISRCRSRGGSRRWHRCRVVVPQQANIAAAQVTLPHSAFLANAHIAKTCGRPELASHSCPSASIYGHARAITPLLDQPLEGPVYLATGFGYELPALVADLNGRIEVLLKGKVDSGREDGIRNTFEVVPDAPVSKFTLHMFGGKKGLIELSENLCDKHAKRTALARFTAQNGRSVELEPTVATSCRHGGKHHRRHGGHRRGHHHGHHP